MPGTIQPKTLHLIIPRGTDWEFPFTLRTGAPLTPMNLTGFTGAMQFKKDASSPAVVTLTDTDGLTFGSGEDNIWVRISAARTVLFEPDELPYVYDLLLVEPGSGKKRRPLQGTATITPQVTQLA